MDAALQRAASAPRVSTAHPLVVKLGGSVVRSAELAAWLDAIAQAPRPVVVPFFQGVHRGKEVVLYLAAQGEEPILHLL